MSGTLFIISAPSGAGKTTLLQALYEDMKDDYLLEKVITYTTKNPRGNEKDGIDYHFVSKARFNEMLEDGEFMEYSKAYVDYYGSPASVIEGLKKGVSYLLIVDRIGAEAIKHRVPQAVLFWVEAPSLEVLKDRMVRRGALSEGVVARRLQRAVEEMRLERATPLYTHHIINDKFDAAFSTMKGLISQRLAKKCQNSEKNTKSACTPNTASQKPDRADMSALKSQKPKEIIKNVKKSV